MIGGLNGAVEHAQGLFNIVVCMEVVNLVPSNSKFPGFWTRDYLKTLLPSTILQEQPREQAKVGIIGAMLFTNRDVEHQISTYRSWC